MLSNFKKSRRFLYRTVCTRHQQMLICRHQKARQSCQASIVLSKLVFRSPVPAGDPSQNHPRISPRGGGLQTCFFWNQGLKAYEFRQPLSIPLEFCSEAMELSSHDHSGCCTPSARPQAHLQECYHPEKRQEAPRFCRGQKSLSDLDPGITGRSEGAVRRPFRFGQAEVMRGALFSCVNTSTSKEPINGYQSTKG